MIHRFTVGQLRALGSLLLPSALLLSCALLPACTLITDVNREDIPPEEPPVFPARDAGADASVPGPGDIVDAGAPDAGEVLADDGADGGDGGDAAAGDAGGDAG